MELTSSSSVLFAFCWRLKVLLGSADFLLHASQTLSEGRVISSLVDFDMNVDLLACKCFTDINWFNFTAS